ncbi:isoleucine--tRNA ligase [Candidatus Saccharibacteria bacterium]|nr:isoleucine--tRNA ligase [Candidatus Saccharibacteria bacterium]
MRYQAGSRRRAIEYEKDISEWWCKNQIFEKSVKQRPVDKSYVFYDGPPFITGNPHHGTLLSSVVKDAVPRFWTMCGYHCERRWGWDCHGLPAENFVEKQLGITDRREIGTKWSLEDYIVKARESMVANSATWEGTINRVGRWVDFKGAYRTMDKDFMESVWWAFKTLYDAGKIYEGRKVLMYDTKFATPVSKAEVTMDNDAYKEVTDPSAYVKFKVKLPEELFEGAFSRGVSQVAAENEAARAREDGPRERRPREKRSLKSSYDNIFLLAWTTTPWTLPANMCLAVNPEMKYGIYDVEGEKFILAVERAEVILPDLKPEGVTDGKNLVGLEYEPLIEVADGLFDLGLRGDKGTVKRPETYTVVVADFVSGEDGTGIVHCAPAYGEDDYALSLEHEIDFVDCLDENGYYLPEMAEKLHELGVRDTDEHGINAWDGNKFIAKILEAEGKIWKIEYIKHEYPFNPRSKERIMYRAFPSWFFDVVGSKTLMLEQNENIHWFPEYLKHGRFAKNIEQAPDWNLSRDRFWATAMPVWKGDNGSVKVVGSYDELYELSGVRLDDYHRPWVDDIEFDIDGEHFTRIEKVLDCWFESGSMPFAQLHYPFENKEKFERNYPADFIVEYVGQVRAWFYYVHCVNTALADVGAFGELKHGKKNAYKNVITTGTLAGNDGRKMSKSLGNYTDPNELMDKYSADSLRFLLLSSPVLSGEDFALLDKDVSDVARKLSMIWNVYDFFTTYASVDKIDSEELSKRVSSRGVSQAAAENEAARAREDGPRERRPREEYSLESSSPLDIWIVSRVHQLRNEITEGMEAYDLPRALEGVLPFVDDLSNWFVRRSRRRFWKSEDDDDKMNAYATLYYVLVYLSKILAPFVPFLAEELYKKMTGDEGSVHLLDWPEAGEIDEEVLKEMARTREIITEGLALRMQKSETEEQIKVRQPLSLLSYGGDKLPEFYEQIIANEVNVKKVVNSGNEVKLDKTLTNELKEEGFVRELIRQVQSARKKAGLNVDDRIKLAVMTEVPKKWQETLMNETLAVELTKENYAYDEIVKINGENITISLEKA